MSDCPLEPILNVELTLSLDAGGRIAYSAQTAWLQNASLRENIVFGRPFDEKR